MPPEPLPWDRKDFFKERKHERSESLGSVARWRDSPHHAPRDFNRWASGDFRRPPGHGKQGGWHVFSDDSGHGYGSSRSGDKMVEDESFRPSFSRGDGRYGRNSRDNRGPPYSQRESKGYSWETRSGSPNMPGRPNRVNNEQRSQDDMLTYSSHQQSDFGSTWDQIQLKDQLDKMGGSTGLGSGQKCERENSLVSIDWKPLKWTRSGSMSSRGSGFSHSSSSKSMGPIDSNEAKVESQPKTATPVQSPSGEATNCVTSAAPLEETTSRKKPRLGWGEGLAKYEKKKVDVPDGSMNKDAAVCSVGNTEPAHSLSSSLPDKSPRVTVFSDCASPATPSSVACSSSPGVEEKSFCKAVNVENDTRNFCGSPGPMSQIHHEGFSFQLEKLDGNSLVNMDSSILELLQSDDPSSVDSSIPRPTALNKLLIWKGEISKVLEVTESEIDSLENELKALKSDSGGSCPHPATSSSLPVEEKDKSCKEQVTNLITWPSPLQIHSSGDTNVQKMCVDNGDQVEFCGIVKDEDIDSPGTATSKFVESLPLVSSDMTNKTGGSEDRDPIQTTKGEETCLVPSRYAEKTDPSTCGNSSMLLDSEVVAPDSGVVVDKLCDSIFSANKIFASRASDIFSKLLSKEHISGVSVSSSWKNDSLIKEKFAKRKRHLRFMERVITLKFKAFQHLWKEDMSVLSMRKYRSKSHKKFELSLRATNNGHQKHRSSIRSRFSTPGSLSLVPTTEIINFTNKLLSDSQVKPYRNSLKMPALILDKEEKLATRFVSSNGLVEDPCAVEKERALMNPWTPEEKELFIQKLTTYGKDFRKISSFLDHKTTADCVEFYYKHHKSDCFVKTKKKPDMAKQGKSSANTYLISDGKKWNREMDAASLDILGAASAIAAHADGGTRNRQTYSRRLILGAYRNTNTSRSEDTTVERSCSLDTIGNERETAAADVLAGICGSMSSEAVSSCITSSIDPGESYLEWKCQKGDSVVRQPLTPDVMQNVDDETCSDESCGEMDPSDWTDEEKSRFIQAVSSYGKDFAMISRCIRSRSQHQCKVFFSKARKCLGLDFVHPGPGNGTSVGDDANGGGSDTEDACVLETGSGISSDKSGCNMNEDVPPSVTNMNADEADPAETMKLQTSPPRPEENNVMGEVDHGDGKPLKSLASDAFQTVDKPKLVFDGDTDIMDFDAMGGNATENKILVAESRPVGEGINSDPPNPECMVGEKLVGQISSDRFGKKLEGSDERSNRDPSGCCLPASAHNSCGNTSDVAADGSCSGPGLNPECPCQVSVELNSVQNPSVISLTHENAPATAVSVPQDSAVIECEKSLSQDRLSSTLDLREGSVGRDESRKHLSGLLGHANVEPLQVLRGYPLQMVPKKETNGDVSCGNLSEVKPDRNINGHYMTQDDFLQFGNSKPQCSRVDCPPLPLKVEKPGDARKAHSWSSTDSDKPSRNGDVKLFGKILSNPSSLSQSNGSIHENEEEGAHNQKLSSKSSNLNLTGHHSADGNSPLLKFDCSSYLGLENVPSRSYGGFWEGNKVQAGNSSFADSAILLAKYPAAFSNFPTSSSQMEQQPLQAVVKTNDRSMNGISVFRGEEINGSNGVADYPVFSRGQDGGNKVQPFTVDVKQQQRQDVLDIPRRNGFDAISSIQQQGRGSVGMNVVGRGGILVGGPCTVVSDPVAAIRMHYAKTEQYGGQAGSIFRKEESWRGGKGDIGR
ncbi:hypothetical protein ACFX13_041858 [Malus domestica]|nr:uncharacterized protein LOC103444807 isoform X2 [Malus domestica]